MTRHVSGQQVGIYVTKRLINVGNLVSVILVDKLFIVCTFCLILLI